MSSRDTEDGQDGKVVADDAPWDWLPGDVVVSRGEAAHAANVSPDTATNWSVKYAVGRQMERGGHWRIQLAPMLMIAAADRPALEAYKGGDRVSELVIDFIRHAAKLAKVKLPDLAA